VHVAAAALVDADGRVLLARRADDAHQGGLWEFPGGKLEPGESVDAGLRRELHEELGIDVVSHRPLIRIRHDYPDRSVLLDVHLVDQWHGEPHGREGQPLAWVAKSALSDYPMPPADVPIINALRLPSTYLITPPRLDDVDGFLRSLDASLAAGASLLQMRVFDIPDDELLRVGREVCERCHAISARVLLNGDGETMRAIGADGLHLNSRALQACRERPVPGSMLLAASCHSAADLDRAARLGADFALLSPVLPTRSHPDAEPLGWERFAELVDAARLPVYALGGMDPEKLAPAWHSGAQGVAGIRGLWVDPA
jgi:8-oxo-dGTP diphosphatase